MQSLTDHTVIVAGGTANVGSFVVKALLERQATVVVPSRSEERLGELREHLSKQVGETDLDRLHTVVGNLGEESERADLMQRIFGEVGTPDAVLASLGDFVTTPSLLDASADDLRRAFEGYVVSNFVVARTFLPVLKDSEGTYVLVQGPLAFEPYPGFGADLISIATAAQHMLFRALSQELDKSRARVVELVVHALIRDRRTQPSSPLPGEAIGAYAAHLLFGSDEGVHGWSIQLRSLDQLAEVGLDTENL